MSKKIHVFPKESIQFLDRCSSIIGEYQRDSFNQRTWCEWQNADITSPIEQYLHVAVRTIAQVLCLDDFACDSFDGQMWNTGFYVLPQHRIDQYRVDFLIGYKTYPLRNPSGEYIQTTKEVVVECDSQAFHERTEAERRYEKARDRHLQRNGYTVFRYTGKEILQAPFRVAADIIAYIAPHESTSDILATIREYDKDS